MAIDDRAILRAGLVLDHYGGTDADKITHLLADVARYAEWAGVDFLTAASDAIETANT